MRRPATGSGGRGRRGAAGALSAQLLQAAASLVLQVLAARTLDAAGYGTFALFVAVVVLATALHIGLVGDPLAVLDRGRAATRSALQVLTVVSCGTAAALAAAGSLASGLASPQEAAALALVVVLWLGEETVRRFLMARLQFWAVVRIDLVSGVTAVGTVVLLGPLGVDRTVATFLLAMALGQGVALAAGLALLPRSSWRWQGWHQGGVREVLALGIYRSLQGAVRPAVMLAVRTLVAVVAGRAALGALEAARLFTAPGFQVISGAGSFLLPTFASRERAGQGGGGTATARRAAVGLSGLALLGTAVATAASIPLGDVVTGGEFSVDPLAVAAWGCYAAAVGATVPWGSLATARMRARQVLVVRGFEAVLSVGVVLVVLVVLPVSAVPFALAVGGLGGALLLRRVATPERVTGPEVPVTEPAGP